MVDQGMKQETFIGREYSRTRHGEQFGHVEQVWTLHVLIRFAIGVEKPVIVRGDLSVHIAPMYFYYARSRVANHAVQATSKLLTVYIA
jgi:hypothetical protein